MRKRFLGALAGAMVMAGLTASVAAANHSWGNYHWARTANPFTIQLGDNMSASWDPLLARASSDWSRSSVLDTVVVAGAAKGKCRPTAGRVEVCNGNYGFNGWLGLAQIWLTGGSHITQGAAKMNDSYFSSGYTTTNKQHVVCQEIGHTFGLDHQDESGADLNTCMDYSNNLDNPSPNQHDYDQLGSIYAHLDSFSTVGTAPTGLAGSAHASPTAVERSDRITSSTITNHYADGSKLVTHILWALDGPERP